MPEQGRHLLYAGDEVEMEGERRRVARVVSAWEVELESEEDRKNKKSGAEGAGEKGKEEEKGELGRVATFRQIKPETVVAHGPFRDSEELRRHFALGEGEYDAAAGTLLASVASHEVFKRGGKFLPLDQFFWHRSETGGVLAGVPTETGGTRPLRLLVVGAGAIGCELLKILALSPHLDCEVILADPDCIEHSNLSRQLLYRAGDVGLNKAAVAAREIARMNPRISVRPVPVLLGPATEAALGESLFVGVDCVLGAVDNLEARLFVDSRCRWHGVPLVDAGTQGAKGSVQAVVPGLTESYGASADPETPQIPQCTLHMFPTKPLHTVMAAADAFHGLFCSPVPVQGELGPAEWARWLFAEKFDVAVRSVLERHPADSVVPESGLLFWSAPRRLPHPLRLDESRHGAFLELTARLREESLAHPVAFDKDGPAHHVEWVARFANLRAEVYGIDQVTPLEARRIAGRIIPAVVTTTATVAALAVHADEPNRSSPPASSHVGVAEKLVCQLGPGSSVRVGAASGPAPDSSSRLAGDPNTTRLRCEGPSLGRG